MNFSKRTAIALGLFVLLFYSSCVLKPRKERYYHKNKHHFYHHVY